MPEISIRRQCELLGVNARGCTTSQRARAENLRLMRLIDEQYTRRRSTAAGA
jgi:hypothetical protein